MNVVPDSIGVPNHYCKHENTIVLIGFGNYGRSILERAILTNIISVEQHVAYHVFGDAAEFLAVHYRLGELFSLNEESKERDSLISIRGLGQRAILFWNRRTRLCM